MVKSWIVFTSESTTTKADHVACWKHIGEVDVLPSDAELEAATPADWPDVKRRSLSYIDEATLEMTSGEGAVPTSRVSKKRALTENFPMMFTKLRWLCGKPASYARQRLNSASGMAGARA